MCLIAIAYRQLADAPVAVAANREEFYQRPTQPPHVLPQPSGQRGPRIMCGLDLLAGGTWLGINDRGVLVAVTNRPRVHVPLDPRSRGLLCLELLQQASAAAATQRAAAEARSGRYNGGNFVCVDAESGHVVQAGDEVQVLPLEAGLHVITNGDLNDTYDSRLRFARDEFARSTYTTASEFLQTATRICAIGPEAGPLNTIILRGPDRGTVSSSLITLTTDPRQTVYRYTAGAPDRTPYEDLSPLAREMLLDAR